MEYDYILAGTKAQFSEAEKLFREYAASLNFDLCFQGFDQELVQIAIQYNQPQGALILVQCNAVAVGCAGVRKLDTGISELKRMFIQPAHRGKGLGKTLLEKALAAAERLGYERIRLDTMGGMKAAIGLYQSSGFYPIDPYRYNPGEGALYFEKKLGTPAKSPS